MPKSSTFDEAGAQEDAVRKAKAERLRQRLDSARKAAGIPTTDEYKAAKDAPPPERRLALGACCGALMLVASRGASAMNEILEKDGESEPLRTGSFGLMLLNIAGGLGTITMLIRPGAVRWVYDTLDEAAASIASVLIALAALMMGDGHEGQLWAHDGKLWTENDGRLPHDLILGACVGHLALKTQFNHHLNTYIHFVSFISMMLVADVARASGHSLLLAGAVTHMASYLLRGEGGLQNAFRLHPQLGPEEISAALLAAATWMLGQALIERYQATSPLY